MPDLITQLAVIFVGVLLIAGIIGTLVTILVMTVFSIGLTLFLGYIAVQAVRDMIRVRQVRKEQREREEEKWKNEKDARITQLHATRSESSL